MAAKLYVSPWQMCDENCPSQLDSIMTRWAKIAEKAFFSFSCDGVFMGLIERFYLMARAARYLEANIVMVFGDGSEEDCGLYLDAMNGIVAEPVRTVTDMLCVLDDIERDDEPAEPTIYDEMPAEEMPAEPTIYDEMDSVSYHRLMS